MSGRAEAAELPLIKRATSSRAGCDMYTNDGFSSTDVLHDQLQRHGMADLTVGVLMPVLPGPEQA